jgi:hypothetical protein
VQFQEVARGVAINDDIRDMESHYSDAVIATVIHGIEEQQTANHRTFKPTPEELALPSFTRRRLKELSTWKIRELGTG